MNNKLKTLFSHNSDDWYTPKDIYNHFVNERGCIDLFPYCSPYDQYEKSYYNEYLFCNPPYSQMNKVVDYLINQINRGCHIYLLVPSRTDTKWFHKLSPYIVSISFFKGRLSFGDSNKPCPFPSMILDLFLHDTYFVPHVNFNPYYYYEIKCH